MATGCGGFDRRRCGPPGMAQSRAVTGRNTVRFAASALLILAALLPAPDALAQPSRWTAAAWIADLEYLRVRIRSAHVNPFHTLDRRELQSGFDDLRAAIPGRTDFEIAFAMQRLVASLGDGHSWLTFDDKGLSRHFPFDAFAFRYGLIITHAGRGHDRAAGARVTAIDDTPIEAVRAALQPYISRDNEMDVLRQMPLLVRQPLALHAAGVTEHRDRAVFTLVSESGTEFTETFSGMSTARYKEWHESISTPEDAPLHRQRNDEPFWYQELEGEDALYFQFNAFQEKRRNAFESFLDGMFEEFDDRELGGLIMDVRHNSGGHTRLLYPLLERIRKHSRLRDPRHLYLITGRETFSSALMLSVRLKRDPGVIIAGEPGSGKPNSYGEYVPFELPHTGLRGSLSGLLHQEGEPFDRRDAVAVDLPAPPSYEAYRDHRDPALEAVLAYWQGVRP